MSDPVTRLNAALVGRYAIERELGEGGMATVYLADDLKHERKVALKVLKPELAAVVGAERFLAEIKTTANLTHPHILPLFDSGEVDSFLFYVMPHIEGESLRERIDREKQLPVDDAVKITTDLAEALDYAHRHKIIHRDIKPANILIHEGRPLIADFGIALAVGVAGGGRLTETGLSLGTPHYMSPEQATGDQMVGATTDIYALGCVLYEMLVGEPPFTGPNAQAVLGQIITSEVVSATEKRASIPSNVDAAIRKALEKLPADRFTSAQDFVKALGDEHFRYGELATAGGGGAAGAWNRLSIATATLAALFAVAFAWLLLRPESPLLVAEFESPFRSGQEPASFGSNAFNLARDGSLLVYSGPGDGGDGRQLWVRRWDDPEASPVRRTEGADFPVVSSDGRQLAFRQGGEIKVLSFEGGPVRPLAEGIRPRWGPDGYIYFLSSDKAIRRVLAEGGEAELVRALADDELNQYLGDFLPGGEDGLMYVERLGGELEIGWLRLGTGEMTTLIRGQGPRYATSGHVTFVANGSLMAAAFDRQTMEIGPPVPLRDSVRSYTLSETGTLVYSTAAEPGQDIELVWLTRSGDVEIIDPGWQFDSGVGAAGSYGWRLSPAGTRVAVTRVVDGNTDIWVKQLPDGPFEPLTLSDDFEMSPIWSPNGEFVVYSRGGSERNLNLWRSRADGTGNPELLIEHPGTLIQGRWSADGEWILVRTMGTQDILGFRPGADTITTPFLATGFAELGPALSPDGRWLAYSSDRSGGEEVYLRPVQPTLILYTMAYTDG